VRNMETEPVFADFRFGKLCLNRLLQLRIADLSLVHGAGASGRTSKQGAGGPETTEKNEDSQ